MLELNHYAEQLQVPGIRKFANRVSEFPDAINLTIGQPDFSTPETVKEAVIDAIHQNKTTYSHNQGLLELRTAVSQFMADKYEAYYTSEQILITNGASEALDTTLRTLLNPGDEVIIPGPIYAGYIPLIENMGAVPVIIDTTQNQCILTPELLQPAITPNTKALLINYPNNPTGITLTREETESLAEFLARQDFYTISDEIYAENSFEQKHTSFGQFESLKSKLILINGLSKSHAMTGFRIGFCMAETQLLQHITIVHAYNCICASVPGQYGALAAVTVAKNASSAMNLAYIERRDYCDQRLRAMGLESIPPKGAFYLFVDISKFNLTSMDFAVMALEQYGVVIVPGSTFTVAGEGYIRISYAYHMDVLKEGLNRLEKMINDLEEQ